MISIEEFNDVQIGDQIKIVDNWEENSGAVAEMNYLLGKTLEVTQIGDQIKIVDKWNKYSDAVIDMDYLLGRTLEVAEKATETTVRRGGTSVFIIQDGECGYVWALNRYCIEKVIKYATKSIADESLEKMLGV